MLMCAGEHGTVGAPGLTPGVAAPRFGRPRELSAAAACGRHGLGSLLCAGQLRLRRAAVAAADLPKA
jgi:hypothetical protein